MRLRVVGSIVLVLSIAACTPPPGVRLDDPPANWTGEHPSASPVPALLGTPPTPRQLIERNAPFDPLQGRTTFDAADFLDAGHASERLGKLCGIVGSECTSDCGRGDPARCASKIAGLMALETAGEECRMTGWPKLNAVHGPEVRRAVRNWVPEWSLFNDLQVQRRLCSSRWRERAARVAIEAMLVPYLRTTRSPTLIQLTREWNGEGAVDGTEPAQFERTVYWRYVLGAASLTDVEPGSSDVAVRRTVSLAPGTLLEITQVDNLRTRLNLEQAGCSDAGLPRQTKFTCTTPDAESGQLDCTLVDDAERSTVPCRPMASPPRISRLSVPLRYLPDGARHLQTPQQLMAQGWLAAAMGQHDVLCDDEKVCTRHFPVCSPGAIRRDLEEDATCGNPLPELKLDQWASMVEASDAQVRFWNGLLDPRLGDLSLAIATSPSGAPAVTQLEVNAFAALLPTIPATWRDQGNGATPSSEESHYASLLDALSYFRGNMRRADVPTGPIGWRTVGGALGVPGNAATTTTSMRRMLGLSDADFGTNGKHPVAYPYNVVPTRDSPFTYIADPSGGGMFDLQVRAVPGGVRWSDMVEPWSLAEWQASGIYGRFEPKLSSIDWQAGCASATGKVKRRRLSTALLWPGDPRVANVELRLDVQQTGHAALFLVPRGRDPALSSDHCAAIEMLRQMQRKKDGLRLDYRDLRRLDLPGGNDLAVRRCLVQPDASTCGVPWAFVPERFRYQGGDGGGQRRLSGDHKRCGALRWDAATGLGLEDVPCETRDLLSTFATAVAEHATSVSGWDLFRIPSPDVPHRITAIELPEVGPVAILQENAEGGCKPTLALAHSRHPWRGAIEVVPVAAPADGCPQAASEQVLWSLTPRHVLSVEGLTHSPLRGFAEAAP